MLVKFLTIYLYAVINISVIDITKMAFSRGKKTNISMVWLSKTVAVIISGENWPLLLYLGKSGLIRFNVFLSN
jgi:hypothetical protein